MKTYQYTRAGMTWFEAENYEEAERIGAKLDDRQLDWSEDVEIYREVV